MKRHVNYRVALRKQTIGLSTRGGSSNRIRELCWAYTVPHPPVNNFSRPCQTEEQSQITLATTSFGRRKKQFLIQNLFSHVAVCVIKKNWRKNYIKYTIKCRQIDNDNDGRRVHKLQTHPAHDNVLSWPVRAINTHTHSHTHLGTRAHRHTHTHAQKGAKET